MNLNLWIGNSDFSFLFVVSWQMLVHPGLSCDILKLLMVHCSCDTSDKSTSLRPLLVPVAAARSGLAKQCIGFFLFFFSRNSHFCKKYLKIQTLFCRSII